MPTAASTTVSVLLLLLLVTLTAARDRRMCKSASVVATRQGIAALARSLVGKTINYTQSEKRWSGITSKTCPPAVPAFADCSSFVTWLFWTTFGNGTDYLNDGSWSWGNTRTMFAQGRANQVFSASDRLPGDVVLYGSPTVNHATIYVGNDEVVTFGVKEGQVDPIRLRPVTYNTNINGTYRYPDFFAIGSSCVQSNGKTGTCIDVDTTACNGVLEVGRCDGPAEVRCCVLHGGSSANGGADSTSTAAALSQLQAFLAVLFVALIAITL